jgi:hypothetical protein
LILRHDRDRKIIDLWIDSQLAASSKSIVKDASEKNLRFEDVDIGNRINISANADGGWAPALADLAHQRARHEKRSESFRLDLEKKSRNADIRINPKYR